MDPNSGSGISHSPDPGQTKFLLDGEEALESAAALPETYGDNKLVAMPRDPLWFFTYWEITPDRFESLRGQVGDETWQKGQAVLRVYDVTGLNGDVTNAQHFFDVAISCEARRWYVNVPEPGRSYVAELGFKFPDGRFFPLLRSNRITLPWGRVSEQTDSRWMIVNVTEWEKMFEIADQHSRSSAEISKMMAQRWEFLRSVFSGSSSRLSSPPLQPVPPAEPPPDRIS